MPPAISKDNKCFREKIFSHWFLICYVAATVVAIFFVLECAVRFLHLAPSLQPHYMEFVRDECLPFSSKPNSIGHSRPWPEGNEFDFVYKTNSMGFRDTEHSFEKPKGVLRILTIGDSYTAGSGAPFGGSYPSQLGKFLNERLKGNPPVEIINAGKSRYWPEPERILIETVGVKFAPDLILVTFTPNDVTDTYLGINFNLARDGYLVSREGYELGSIGIWLYIHSQLFRKIIRVYLDQKFKHLVYNNPLKMKWKEVFIPNGYHEKDWQRVESEYEKMIKVARKINAQIAFVCIPSSPYDSGYPAKRLTEWGRRKKVLVIDTLPALHKAAKTEKVYWSKDIHCTEAGYRSIAESVSSRLIDSYFATGKE